MIDLDELETSLGSFAAVVGEGRLDEVYALVRLARAALALDLRDMATAVEFDAARLPFREGS